MTNGTLEKVKRLVSGRPIKDGFKLLIAVESCDSVAVEIKDYRVEALGQSVSKLRSTEPDFESKLEQELRWLAQ